jgi:hypothetical protein
MATFPALPTAAPGPMAPNRAFAEKQGYTNRCFGSTAIHIATPTPKIAAVR